MICLFKKVSSFSSSFKQGFHFCCPQPMAFHWDHNALFYYFFKNYIVFGLLKTFAALLLIKHDGFRVLVCHLGHVSQNILFCDDSKKSPGVETKQKKKEVSLTEEIHDQVQGQAKSSSFLCG